MDEKMDHGAILTQEEIPLDALATDYPALEERLAMLSARLLARIIPALLDGTPSPRAQDESQATLTKKFTTQDGFIEHADLDAALAGDTAKAELTVRIIHALDPEPGAWTIKDGKRIKLLEAEILNGALDLIATQREGEKVKKQKPRG
jgi:methionyl-tRNA formyltransferase